MRRFRRRKQEKDEIIEGEIIDETPSEEAPKRSFFNRKKDSEASPEDESSETPPIERVAPDVPTPDEMVITEFTRRSAREGEAPAPSRRFRLSRLLLWRAIRPGLLFLAAGLVAGGIFWTLYNLGRVPEDMKNIWTWVLLVFALGWSLISLITRRAGAFLASTALAGISLSLILDTQGFAAWKDTLVGIVLITVGLGIIARGLLLRQGSVAR